MGKKLDDRLRVEPGSAAGLEKRDPGDRLDFGDKQTGLEELAACVERLSLLHNRLFAEARRAVLLVLQGLDAAGKDGTVRRVLSGVNPQGCRVVSFKEPSAADLAHDYLRRIHEQCPARGEIGIFNRSHYEDFVAVRVHDLAPREIWARRPHHFREFERLLVDEGTTVVKVFLHVSADEQRTRLQERIDNPEKAWKFSPADLTDRARRRDYLEAYEDVISETSTDWAPWYVVPADHNWVRNLAVARLLLAALERIEPQLPPSDPAVASVEIT